jgi:hypothetical protein
VLQAKGLETDVETMSLVTRPGLMAAPRHHACAVHEKEATSGRADLRIDEKSSTIQEAVQPRDQGSERKTQHGKFHEGKQEGKMWRGVTTTFGVWRFLLLLPLPLCLLWCHAEG